MAWCSAVLSFTLCLSVLGLVQGQPRYLGCFRATSEYSRDGVVPLRPTSYTIGSWEECINDCSTKTHVMLQFDSLAQVCICRFKATLVEPADPTECKPCYPGRDEPRCGGDDVYSVYLLQDEVIDNDKEMTPVGSSLDPGTAPKMTPYWSADATETYQDPLHVSRNSNTSGYKESLEIRKLELEIKNLELENDKLEEEKKHK